MKRIALYFGIATVLVASCSVQEEDFKTPQQGDVIYYASFEQPTEEGTRVFANEDLLLRWTADDRVSIFGKNTFNQQYRFLGETGDNSGGFSKVDGAEYVTGNPISHTVSVYPYQASTKITDDEVLSVTLPAEQHYAENTFGLGANAMVSVSADNFLQYKNVGGFLRLSLYGEGVTVSSITLKGNNGERLAGKASVTMPLDGVPTAVMADDATTDITLICETPVQLGATAEESTQFWFVIPPVTFSKGFTMTVNEPSSGTFEKSTDKTIKIERNNLSKMSPIEVVPVANKYLTFTSEGTTTVSLTNYGDNSPVLYYSTDKSKWIEWDYSDLTFTKDQPLYIYGDNPDGFSHRKDQYSIFVASGFAFSISGDIMSLIDREQDLTVIPSAYCFYGLFSDCNGLVSAPKLPATGLTSFCYSAMFYGCSSLTTAPKLPATTLAKYCYSVMFSHCSKLTAAPDLPATTLAYNCYSYMFEDCSSLTTAPDLPATTLAGGCYHRMFFGCGSLTTAPKLPATKLADLCYMEMFSHCSKLTAAPDLPATTLANSCYMEMFYGCSSLNHIKCLATDISVDYCVSSWLSGVSTTGTFIKASGMDDWPTGSSGIPEGWTVVDGNPISIPEAVDLGLPSGVKWASFNLGASKPEEYGDDYAWGETGPKSNYDWSTYKWSMGSNTTLTKYCTDSSNGYNGYIDGKTVLDPEDDAAHVTLGGKWRMPTNTEWQEIMENCTWEWPYYYGLYGYLVTGPNGNSIFLPAAGCQDVNGSFGVGDYGYYWSSSLCTDYPNDAWVVAFRSNYVHRINDSRVYGQSVRPVCE